MIELIIFVAISTALAWRFHRIVVEREIENAFEDAEAYARQWDMTAAAMGNPEAFGLVDLEAQKKAA